VKKLNGETIITPRLKDVDFPHPVLSGGDDVVAAGTIRPEAPGVMVLTNNTGHYKVHGGDMRGIFDEFVDAGFNVIERYQ